MAYNKKESEIDNTNKSTYSRRYHLKCADYLKQHDKKTGHNRHRIWTDKIFICFTQQMTAGERPHNCWKLAKHYIIALIIHI